MAVLTDEQAAILWDAICTLRYLGNNDLADSLMPLIERYREAAEWRVK